MLKDALRERISIVRTKLLSKVPFLGHLVMKLQLLDGTGLVATMGVTRDRRLFINPEWVETLTDEELAGVLCHETLHVALLCFERQGNRLATVMNGVSLWNLASDYADNQIIVDFKCPYLKLPKGGFQDDKYRDMSSEEIYDLLREEDESGSEGDDSEDGEGEGGEGESGGKSKGQGGSEGGESGEGRWGHDDMREDGESGKLSPAECKAADTQWKVALHEARLVHEQSKVRGSIPGALQKVIDELMDPKVDWVDVLSRWVGENGRRADFTWARPHRRSESVGEFLPSMKRHGVDDIVVLWDTSGSMYGSEQRILSEVIGICEDLGLSLRVICCDMTVCSDQENVSEADEIDVKGGGGSDFNPGFDLLHEDNFEGVVVAFTDGYIGVPDVKPVFIRDVLWVIGPQDIDPTRGSWGEVLQVDAEGFVM